jgi:hypothetical protein
VIISIGAVEFPEKISAPAPIAGGSQEALAKLGKPANAEVALKERDRKMIWKRG